MRLYDRFCDREPQAAAFDLTQVGRVASEKPIEHPRQLLGRDPGAGVGYGQLSHVFELRQAEFDSSPGSVIFNRILD